MKVANIDYFLFKKKVQKFLAKINMQYKALPKAGLVLQLNLVGKLTKYTKSFTLKWALYLTFSWVGRPITSLGGATELRIYLKLNFQ